MWLFLTVSPFSSRLYAALCRLVSGLDQAQALVCELILKSKHLSTVEAIVSVWPYCLARNNNGTTPPLFIGERLQYKGELP